jgi:hypothetical protein
MLLVAGSWGRIASAALLRRVPTNQQPATINELPLSRESYNGRTVLARGLHDGVPRIMQTLTLLHSQSFPIGLYADGLTRESIASSSLDNLDELLIGDASSLRVVLVDKAITNGRKNDPAARPRTAVVGVGLEEQPRWLGDDSIYLHLPENPSTGVLLSAVKRAYQFLYQKQRADQLERQLTDRTRELQEVAQVGVSLSTVRDHSVLLTMILSKARELSRSDAGSLYLLDEQDGNKACCAGSSRRTIRSTSKDSKSASCRSRARASRATWR